MHRKLATVRWCCNQLQKTNKTSVWPRGHKVPHSCSWLLNLTLVRPLKFQGAFNGQAKRVRFGHSLHGQSVVNLSNEQWWVQNQPLVVSISTVFGCSVGLHQQLSGYCAPIRSRYPCQQPRKLRHWGFWKADISPLRPEAGRTRVGDKKIPCDNVRPCPL